MREFWSTFRVSDPLAARFDLPQGVAQRRPYTASLRLTLDGSCGDLERWRPSATLEILKLRARLLARIRARLPGGPVPGAASTIREEAFELDPARRQLSVEGQIVPLPRSEFRLLEGLMRQSGRVLSRSELCAAIGGTKPASEQAVDIHVRRLRRKLAPHGDRGRCIRAVRGFGYVFRPPSKLDPPI